jgi:hypothetical protein
LRGDRLDVPEINVTEPLNYQTPLAREKAPLLGWVAIALALLAVGVDLIALYSIRQTPTTITINGATVTAVTMPPPLWVRVVQVTGIATPFIGLGLAIVALIRSGSSKSVAIAAIVANAITVCILILLI